MLAGKQKQNQASQQSKTEEDELLEQDIEDKRSKHRRHELRLNYDEDSSDEEYQKEKPENPVVEDEDEDMFKSDEEEEKVKSEPEGGDEGEFKFTDINKFNKQLEMELGQEQDEELGDGISDEQEGEEEEEEQEGLSTSYYIDPESFDGTRPKPKAAPKIEAFNLKEEANTGEFDEDGNFVRKEKDDEDKEDEKDSWYSDYSKKNEIERTRKAQEDRDQKMKEKLVTKKLWSIEDLLKSMINHLEAAETPMEKLQSLNKAKPKKKKQINKDDTEAEQKRKKLVEEITSLANELISKGRTDVYDETREELMRAYKEETGEDFVIQNRGSKRRHEDAEYEFMYIGDDEVHGPYSAEELIEWRDTYFDGNVLVRMVGEENFIKIDEFEFDT